MNTQQKLTGARYIADHLTRNHAWGTMDCCTMFLGYHDAVWGKEKSKDVVGKYADKGSAMRFYKRMKLTWRQWLFMNGYEKHEGKLAEGDIAVLDHKLFPTVYIYHNGTFWTMSEDRDMLSVDSKAMKSHENVTVWRHK